jgi:putative methyltransferase (TIGR04325 family)
MLKNLLRGLTPPIVFSALRWIYRRTKVGAPIFDGFYSSMDAVPRIEENAFAHPNWISYVGARAESRREGVADQDMHEMCLTLIGSMLPEPYELTPRQAVVDFGGGVGMYWTVFKAQNKARVERDFVVVDNENNCVSGRTMFGAERVRFEADFDRAIAAKGPVHLLNVASTFHYCLDHKATIAMLCRSGAKFIVVSRHPAPADGLPLAYTVQNVSTARGFCGRAPVLLVGVAALAEMMRGYGYALIADYYAEIDPGKYWRNSRTPVPPEFLRIIDHALVFQKQWLTVAANPDQPQQFSLIGSKPC